MYRLAMPASVALTMLMKFGVPYPAVMIGDFAAAGLIRSGAAIVERFEVDGIRSITDNEELSDELWKRIIREGVVDAVWLDGAVHLCAAPITEEEPHIVVTGIHFAAIDIHMLGYRHRRYVTKKGEAAPNAPTEGAAHAAATEAAVASTQEQATDPPSASEATRPLKGRKRRAPDPGAIPQGAILCTIAQAGAALGIGRTKVNEMMKDGRLERRDIDGGARITVASVMAIANKVV